MESNDVFFSLHAVALTLVVLVQCLLYEVRDGMAPAPCGCQAASTTTPCYPHLLFYYRGTEPLRKDTCLITQHLIDYWAKIIGQALC